MTLGCLVQLSPLDPASGDREDIFVSSFTKPTDARMNGLNTQVWEPAITTLPTVGIPLWEGGFSDNLTPGAAILEINLEIVRQTWPDVCDYVWPGASVTIYHGSSDDTWPLDTVSVGRVRSYSGDYPKLQLRIEVDQEPLLADILTDTYAGTGNEEGGLDIKNRPKPLVIGWAENVEPVLIDATDNVYQFSAYGPIEEVSALYERASSFGDEEGDYADYAALVAADLEPGEWATCLAEGLVRLGAPAYDVITGDVKGHEVSGTTPRLTGDIIETLADIAGVSSTYLDTTSLAALDTAVPYNINLVLMEQVRFYDMARRLARPCNWQAGVSTTNKLFVSPITLTGSGALTLDFQGNASPQVISVSEADVSPPFYKTTMGANRSWRVHAAGEVAQVNGYNGYLSYPAQSIAAAADGTVADYSSLGGTFTFEVDGIPTTEGVTFSVLSETGIDVYIDEDTGVYGVNDMSADDGFAVFKAQYSNGFNRVRGYTVTKARAGAGSAVFSIKGGGQFRYDSAGAIYSGQSIPLTLDRQNLTADFVVKLYRINSNGTTTQIDAGTYLTGSGTVTDNDPDANSFTQTGTTVTLTGANFDTFISTGLGCIIEVTCDTITDTVRILRVDDGATGGEGAPGIGAVLSNEAHTFTASNTGAVSTYTGSGTLAFVYEGADMLAFETGSGTPATPGRWRMTASASGVTEGAISDSGLYATVGDVTAVTEGDDTPYIDFTITGRASDGTTFTIVKRQNFSKSKLGDQGEQGETGDDGAAAKTMTVTSNRQVIFYDSVGDPEPTTQTTVFTALKQNTTATVTWSLTDMNGVSRSTTYLSSSTGDSVNMTESQFDGARNGTPGVIVTATITDGSTITDSISVIRVKDGEQGPQGDQGETGDTGETGAAGAPAVSIVATRKSVQLLAYADGTVISFDEATGRLYVYEDGVDVTSSATLSATASGCTGTINTATNTPVASQPKGYYRVTALPGQIGTLTLTATYNSVTYTEIFTVTRSEVGIQRVTSLPATDLFDGRTVFLSTDKKLYRYDGDEEEWTARVDGADLEANSVTTNAIFAGAITSAELATTTLITLTAQIADGIITNAKITTLDAGKITTGQLAAARIDVDGVFNAAGSSTFTGTLNIEGEAYFGGVAADTLGRGAAIIEVDGTDPSADVAIAAIGGKTALYGETEGSSATNYGVYGVASDATSSSAVGVFGAAFDAGFGGSFQSTNGHGLRAQGGSGKSDLLLAGAGAVSAPAISRAADTDTGIYYSATNTLDIAAGGTQALSVNSTQVLARSGLSDTPQYSFLGDTDTGIAHLDANRVLVMAGGTRALEVSSSQVMARSNLSTTPHFSFRDDTDTGIAHATANQMSLICGGTTVATITATGITMSQAIRLASGVPASSGAAGSAGQIAYGAGYFYWHDGTQWLRAAGSTF